MCRVMTCLPRDLPYIYAFSCAYKFSSLQAWWCFNEYHGSMVSQRGKFHAACRISIFTTPRPGQQSTSGWKWRSWYQQRIRHFKSLKLLYPLPSIVLINGPVSLPSIRTYISIYDEVTISISSPSHTPQLSHSDPKTTTLEYPCISDRYTVWSTKF